jgi:hypothetical protein
VGEVVELVLVRSVCVPEPARPERGTVDRLKVPVIPSLVWDGVEALAQVFNVRFHNGGFYYIGIHNVGVDPAAGVDLPEQVHLQRDPWAEFEPDDRAQRRHGPHAAL